MPLRPLLLFACQVVALERELSEPESWAITLVDVPSLVCDSSADKLEIQLDQPREHLDAPHILSFFRTSPLELNLTFSLRSADGQVILPNHSVIFADVTETAKANMTYLHEWISGARRMSESEPLGVRRLESLGGFGYKTAEGGRVVSWTWRNTWNPGVGMYGYASDDMYTHFPFVSLQQRTGYGYVGRGGNAPYSYSAQAGLVSVAIAVAAYDFRWSRSHTRCFGNRCSNSTVGGACSTEDPCEFRFRDDEDLIRDDVMNLTGFLPDQHPGPYTLEIHGVRGEHFSAARICPAAAWQGEHDSSWSLPEQQDLFVAISRAEAIVDDKRSYVIVAIMIAIVLGIPVAICCAMYLNPPNMPDWPFEEQPSELQVGARIKGLRSDGKYYDATISEVLEDRQCRVIWDDGELGETVRPETHVHIQELRVGERVTGKRPDGKWYDATVTEILDTDDIGLSWDDGESRYRTLPTGHVRRQAINLAANGGGQAGADYRPGLPVAVGGVAPPATIGAYRGVDTE